MSEASGSDILGLFSPRKSKGASDSDVLPPNDSSPVPESGKSTPPFYVMPPVLSSAQKTEYKKFDELAFYGSDIETDERRVEEVVGEYKDGRTLFLYARFDDGIVRRYPAARFRAEFGGLVNDYEQRKDEGTLSAFDPSATYVHPKSRVHLRININRSSRYAPKSKKAPMQRGQRSMSDEEIVPETDAEEEEQRGNSDDEYGLEDSDASIRLRRTTRVAAGGKRKMLRDLPFSPKKTRSGKAFVVPDSDEEGEGEIEEVAPTRRSTRTRISAKQNLDDQNYMDEIDEIEDSEEETRPRKATQRQKKKVTRSKASRPAYGHFRDIADLACDPYSDEETAPLRAHRDICEKCHRQPTHRLVAAARKSKRGRRKSRKSDDEEDDAGDVEKLGAMGGWVRCLKCPVSAHWRCLARKQQDEILRAVRERDRLEWRTKQALNGDQDQEMGNPDGEHGVTTSQAPGSQKRTALDASQTTEFICGSCMKGGVCMGCMEVAIEPEPSHSTNNKEGNSEQTPAALEFGRLQNGDVEMKDGSTDLQADQNAEDLQTKSLPHELLFRCFTCKRIAHYSHLPIPSDQDASEPMDPVALANYYQDQSEWQCADCASYKFPLDKILAWRPYPATAIEPGRSSNEVPSHKIPLPREYLVKWVDRSYRRTEWVPHMWLVATHSAKLRNFLEGGPKVQLLKEPVPERQDTEEEGSGQIGEDLLSGEEALTRDEFTKPEARVLANSSPVAMPDAERRIPLLWKTVDRVLDALLWCPRKRSGGLPQKAKHRARAKGKSKANKVVDDEDDDLEDEDDDDDELEDEDADNNYAEERTAVYEDGDQPSEEVTETLDEWEDRTGQTVSMANVDRLIDRVVWAFIKWDDLGYDEATWDSPPRRGEFGWAAFRTSFERLVASREVVVPIKPKSELAVFDRRPEDEFKKKYAFRNGKQPSLGQAEQLSLMPFQIDGVNWLCNNWWNLQHCILADEMGLGKTVQIASFIGTIAEKWKAFPALIVVPNSTITNWVREFERWAPKLRVVPFYGEAKSRDVIKHYELEHNRKNSKTTGAKYHVLVTTYDTVASSKDFTSVFKKIPRWEVLVVDEGQRLKSDASLLFKKLNQLNTIQRILMTGTPLNNNMRELFNLMNFLDPKEWNDLEKLEKEHEQLTDELVQELHQRLRPYFLRRTKSEVLPLPPKNEVIVPVSMSPLQKEVYRSILSHNFNVLQSLTQRSRISGAVSKSNMNNILMQLRKCLQHPYLVSNDIEPRGLPEQETHEKLIGASAKLRLLKTMLPKLKARGHRILLFSQFIIALNIVEDFLVGEGYNYLRLDGDTKQADRQKGMDEFNRPGSEVFIYILSTRAGGVGINLWSADTVIIFDPDFNPHQDLQAIARSHRYGQTKTCLVFKLVVKDSAEERIMQNGKKKLVLDHLIVQNMDDEGTTREDVQSILMFGAKALFDEGADQSARDIIYTDHDIEKLIEKTEKEGEQEEQQKDPGLFAFAKIWSADKDTFEEMADENPDNETDSWAQTLQRIAAEREKVQAQEVTGRGARRRAAVLPKQNLDELDDSPVKGKRKKGRKSESKESDESAYAGSAVASESESDDDGGRLRHRHATPSSTAMQVDDSGLNSGPVPLSPIHNHSRRPHEEIDKCGLCGTVHTTGVCYMTESSENLAEYRRMLLIHADDEPLEDRQAAIQIIDETLYQRGKLNLIHGQPLRLVQQVPGTENPPKKKSKRPQHQSSTHTKAARDSTASINPIAGPSRISDKSAATASSSKRPSSPSLLENHPAKKTKSSTGGAACVVCGRVPHHLVKDCPVVAEGPKSVSREIKRLDKDPNQSQTVSILRKILSKQKKRELALSSDAIPIAN